MSFLRIIYTSRPFGFDAATLNSILVHARQANSRDDITGALICREDIYMQLLEGPEPAVRAALARITQDDRHLEVRIHVERPVSERMFANWAMLHDPATSWIWSRTEVTHDAVQNSTPQEVEAFFTKLREEQTAP